MMQVNEIQSSGVMQEENETAAEAVCMCVHMYIHADHCASFCVYVCVCESERECFCEWVPSLCMYILFYVCSYILALCNVYIYSLSPLCMYVCMYIHTYIDSWCIYINIHILFMCTCMYMCICMYMHLYMYIYLYIYM